MKNKLLLVLFLCASFFISLNKIEAATIGFSPQSGTYTVGDTVRVRVFVNSQGQSINAISGALSFSGDTLTLSSISKTGSLITFWAQEPSYSNAAGTASVEGVALGGYSGTSGTIVTLTFRAKKEGLATVNFQTGTILANDGQGTNVFTGANNASFTIAAKQASTTKEVVVTEKSTEEKVPVLRIEEIKKENAKQPKAKFLFTVSLKKESAPYEIIIDDMPAILWNQKGGGTFETPELGIGTHVMKVTTIDTNNVAMSNSITFTIFGITPPVITDYSTTLLAGEYIVVKGNSDVGTDVGITLIYTDTQETEEILTIPTNAEGKFVFVSTNRAKAGTYTVYAHSYSKDGVRSLPSETVTLSVKEEKLSVWSASITKILSIVIPVIGLVLLLVIVIMYGIKWFSSTRRKIRKQMSQTSTLVTKTFDVLEQDLVQEIAILKKIKANEPLDADERQFILEFKRDLEEAEKNIVDSIKKTTKDI